MPKCKLCECEIYKPLLAENSVCASCRDGKINVDSSYVVMTRQEREIIHFALKFLLANWDAVDMEDLYDGAIPTEEEVGDLVTRFDTYANHTTDEKKSS